MKKVILDPTARFKMERLCDGLHPQEVGGVLFGPQTPETIWVNDVFPVANIADNKNTTFKEHGWGNYWRDLYGIANNLRWLGTFHSHPNGTIASEQDMKAYNDSNVHLWVIHHAKGEHTFQASLGLNHVDLELAAMPTREIVIPELTETGFRLGEINIDEYGRLQLDAISENMLKLDEKHRIAYITVLKLQDQYGSFYINDAVKKLNLTKVTVRQRLRTLEKAKLVNHRYRDRWDVKKP
jgi:proteasome lid subunit RPN8/RPN11